MFLQRNQNFRWNLSEIWTKSKLNQSKTFLQSVKSISPSSNKLENLLVLMLKYLKSKTLIVGYPIATLSPQCLTKVKLTKSTSDGKDKIITISRYTNNLFQTVRFSPFITRENKCAENEKKTQKERSTSILLLSTVTRVLILFIILAIAHRRAWNVPMNARWRRKGKILILSQHIIM